MQKISFFLLFFFSISSPLYAFTFSRTQILMGDIPVTISIRTDITQKKDAYAAMQQAFEKVKEIEQEVSHYIPSSPVLRLNQSWKKIPDHLFYLIDYSLTLSQKTQGAFDITYASSNKKASYRDIKLNKNKQVRLKKPGMTIRVLGLAKGYIVDQMSVVLKESGFSEHLIDAGGDLYASGRWKIKIRDPKNPEQVLYKNLTVYNQGVSTSGTYERGPHIIDPASKKQIEKTGSVTIIASSCLLSDSLDNAAFVLGKKAKKIFKRQYPEVKTIFSRWKEF